MCPVAPVIGFSHILFESEYHYVLMADNKKSVLLYCDIIFTVEELDDVDAGLLFKHYLRYINDKNPEPPSKLIKIVFEPIKQNLKRDLIKWEAEIKQRSDAGRKGMEKRWHNNDNSVITKDNTVINPITNITDNVKVTVKVKDTVKDTVIKEKGIPSFFDFENYVISKVETNDYLKIKTDLKFKYDAWVENGWRDGYNKQITKWKSKILQTLPHLIKNNQNGSAKSNSGTKEKIAGVDAESLRTLIEGRCLGEND